MFLFWQYVSVWEWLKLLLWKITGDCGKVKLTKLWIITVLLTMEVYCNNCHRRYYNIYVGMFSDKII